MKDEDGLSKAGIKSYLSSFRTIVIGGIFSFLLILLAILTLFIDGGDSAGPGFVIFGFLALSVFAISCFISLVKSLLEVIKIITVLSQNEESKDEIVDRIAINLAMIFGIILLAFVAYRLFT